MMKYLELAYWLNRPESVHAGIWWYIIPTGIVFFLFIVSLIFQRKTKKNKVLSRYLKPIPEGLFWFSLSGALFSFFRQQNVYVFSSRIWGIIIALAFLLWIFPKAYRFIKNYKHDIKAESEKSQYSQYHPKRKKK